MSPLECQRNLLQAARGRLAATWNNFLQTGTTNSAFLNNSGFQITRTSRAVTCVSTVTRKNVIKPHGSLYVNYALAATDITHMRHFLLYSKVRNGQSEKMGE